MSYLGIFCPIGYDPFGRMCYNLIRENLHWYNADRNCKSVNGHLASISDNETQLFINQMLDEYRNFYGTILSII